MVRAMALLLLTILAATCCASSADPTASEAYVPCSSLFGVRHSESSVMAMEFQEAQQTLANARVIKAVCGK